RLDWGGLPPPTVATPPFPFGLSPAGGYTCTSPPRLPPRPRQERRAMAALLVFAGLLAPGAADPPLPAGAVARLGSPHLRHAARVTAVAFAPDGKSLATASLDRTVCVWDLATGAARHRLRLDVEAYQHDLAFSPDGQVLAAVASNGADSHKALVLWDAAGG